MMSTGKQDKGPQPGDYYGVVYKGGLILPLLTIALAVFLWWWFSRKRK